MRSYFRLGLMIAVCVCAVPILRAQAAEPTAAPQGEKPKRVAPRQLKRVRNIEANPACSHSNPSQMATNNTSNNPQVTT